jgi:hypothetical protein
MQINQFTNTATELGNDDLLGFDARNEDASFTTKKILASDALKELVYTGTSTNNAQIELLVSGGRAVIPVDTAWAFSILLLSWTGDFGTNFAGVWKIEGGIVNNGGTVSLAKNWNSTNGSYSTNGKFDSGKVSGNGITTTVLAGDTSNTFGAPAVDADTDNQALRIRVAAAVYDSNTFLWKARARLVNLTI